MLLNSLLLCCIALLTVFFSKLGIKFAKTVLITILLNLFALLLYSIANYYSKNGVNYAVIAHLNHLVKPATLIQFWQSVLLFFFAIFILFIAGKKMLLLLEKDKHFISKSSETVATFFTPIFLVLALIMNPLFNDLYSLTNGYGKAKELPPLPNGFEDISKLAPPITFASPSNNKNFIIILAENFDATFTNVKYYPGLTPTLTPLIKSQGTQITGIRELQLSNWTDAGISAQLCGVSLTIDSSDSIVSESEQKSKLIRSRIRSPYLVGESCIGDILNNDGYELSFAGGSDFGRMGKSRLFASQGFEKLYFTKEILSHFKTELPKSSWGIHDDALFDFTQKVLSKKNVNPYGFVVLTVDTHAPFNIAPSCNDLKFGDGRDAILNSVHCSDKVIGEFITKILDSPKYNDTVVFLISDHLYQGRLPNINIKRNERDYLFVAFNHGHNQISQKVITRAATALDVGPTILAFLGYDIETLNFGRNLLIDKPTLSESLGLTQLYQNIVKIRHKMRAHWKENNPISVQTETAQ